MRVSPAIVLSLHDSKTTDGTHFELSGERTQGIINFLGVAIIGFKVTPTPPWTV